MTGKAKTLRTNGFTVYCKYTESRFSRRQWGLSKNIHLVIKNKLILRLVFFDNKHSFVYMLSSHLQEAESLPAFRSPSHAITKTLLQLAGEFDFEATFNEGALIYTPTTYILFITFLITMPILFINLLVSCYSTLMLTEE